MFALSCLSTLESPSEALFPLWDTPSWRPKFGELLLYRGRIRGLCLAVVLNGSRSGSAGLVQKCMICGAGDPSSASSVQRSLARRSLAYKETHQSPKKHPHPHICELLRIGLSQRMRVGVWDLPILSPASPLSLLARSPFLMLGDHACAFRNHGEKTIR